MESTTALLQQLVAINSINPDLVPDGPGEREIATFVARWLEQAGVEVTIDEPVAGRPSVVGIVRGSGGGRSLILNAHMDTVGVAGMERPYEARIEGNRLYGRGAFDMKGGLAAIMYAAAKARKLKLRGDVILTAVADEEYASIGTQSILQRWHADAAIVTEPTALELCIAHKGFTWHEIIAYGRAAHGSRFDLGRDAIILMGHVLVGLERLNQALQSAPLHRLLGSGSLHASLIEGGQELSSYPERCVLQVERRTVPGETLQKVEGELNELLEGLQATHPDYKLHMRTTLQRQPFEVAEEEQIVQSLYKQVQQLTGETPRIVSHTPWMDSALFSAVGIPTIVFGPGGEGAHAVIEWANLDEVQQCGDILVATIQDFCA